jgi:hypothetical protein
MEKDADERAEEPEPARQGMEKAAEQCAEEPEPASQGKVKATDEECAEEPEPASRGMEKGLPPSTWHTIPRAGSGPGLLIGNLVSDRINTNNANRLLQESTLKNRSLPCGGWRRRCHLVYGSRCARPDSGANLYYPVRHRQGRHHQCDEAPSRACTSSKTVFSRSEY